MDILLFYWLMIIVMFGLIIQLINYRNRKEIEKAGCYDYDPGLSWLVALIFACLWPITLSVLVFRSILWLLGRRWK